MLETTAESGMRSPVSVTTPLTWPPSWPFGSRSMRAIEVSVRNVTPSLSARATSASGTARVPPIGYHTPSWVCMWAMLLSTAGAR